MPYKNKADRNANERARRAADPEKERTYKREWARKWRDENPHLAAYKAQAAGARHRDIDFLLTFEEWCAIWNTSGKWEQRGGAQGQYVMARKGDVGPYSIGNVRICLARENNKEQAEWLCGRYVSDATRERIGDASRASWASGRTMSDKQRAVIVRAAAIRWAKVRATHEG